MRAIIIGGTGHVGTYLVPRLAEAGYEVICISRKLRKPYRADPLWDHVQMEILDRDELENQGLFGERILRMAPDIVIDMICFNVRSAEMMVEALRGKIHHYLQCGTMWIHGHSLEVPAREDQGRNPFGEYGISKAAVEDYLLQQYRDTGFPVTVIHPGHIVGPGWNPVNPAGNLNPVVFEKLGKRQELILPNLGMETLHHVHADDVAQAFMQSLLFREQSLGEGFHTVSPQAITLRGYAESMARWFGVEANLSFLPWEEWKKNVSEEDASLTWDHIAHSPNGSIEKARRLIQYDPAYTTLEAVQESVQWMMENGRIKIPHHAGR